MRFVLLLLALIIGMTGAAYAVDWRNLGRPVEDDMRRLRDRFVFFDFNAISWNVPLSRPVLVASDIREWLSRRIAEVMLLDGQHYEQQIIVNRRHFTAKGYGDYVTGLQRANIPRLLKQERYRMSAIVIDPPNITAQGVRDEGGDRRAPNYRPKPVYIWQAEVPILLNYTNIDGTSSYRVYLNVEIARIPVQTDNDNTMIAINGWHFSTQPDDSTP